MKKHPRMTPPPLFSFTLSLSHLIFLLILISPRLRRRLSSPQQQEKKQHITCLVKYLLTYCPLSLIPYFILQKKKTIIQIV